MAVPAAQWWDIDTVEQDVRLARMQVDELRKRFAPSARTHVEAGDSDTVVSCALHRPNAGLLVAARQGPALVAAAMACPVLRLSTPSADVTVGSHPQLCHCLDGDCMIPANRDPKPEGKQPRKLAALRSRRF